MPIFRLLEGSAFEPEAVQAMIAAYDQARRELGLSDRRPDLMEALAIKIIEIASRGERDAATLRSRAVEELGIASCDWR